MGIPIIGDVVGGIVDVVKAPIKSWADRKKIETQAKAERKTAQINHSSEWEMKALQNDSWIREWLVLLVSIPMALCFIPFLVDDVKAGFDALEQTPEWYRYLVGSVFSFVFARRELNNVMTKRKSLKVAEEERKAKGSQATEGMSMDSIAEGAVNK